MNFDAFEKKAKELGVLGIVVTKDGKEIGKKLWDEQCRRNVYSASKSFTSTAVGIAVKEGLLSLDEKLVDCFAEDLPETVSDNLAKATVKDLLTMCLGQEKAELMGAQRPVYEEEDWVKMSLAFPFVYEPGTKFVYNNVGPYLAGVLVERRAGCDLVSYLYPRLFKPLGIARPTWELDPYGHVFGAGGLFLTMDELHKLGLLYLQNGNWNGKQLVPESWVKEATSKQVENDNHIIGLLHPHSLCQSIHLIPQFFYGCFYQLSPRFADTSSIQYVRHGSHRYTGVPCNVFDCYHLIFLLHTFLSDTQVRHSKFLTRRVLHRDLKRL